MKRLLAFVIVLLVHPANQSLAQSVKRIKHFNLKDGVALSGYDPVSYIDALKASKGTASLSHTHDDITYWFSSAANREKFKANPAKYEPMYGGWCAYAMGETGEKVEVDPKTFKVTEGRLYLFYNQYFTNTLPKWNKDEKRLMTNADKNWIETFK